MIQARNIYPKILYEGLPEGWFDYTSVLGYWALLDLIPDNSTLVECGNYKGRSICSISPYIIYKKLEVYCIDIDEYNMKNTLKKNIKKYKINKYVKTIKDDVLNSINNFSDKSIDLIMVDSFYDFKRLSKLLILSKPKLKSKESIICGPIGLKNPKDIIKTLNSLFINYNKIFLDQGNKSGLWYVYKKEYR